MKYIHHIWFTADISGGWDECFTQWKSNNSVMSQSELSLCVEDLFRQRGILKKGENKFSYGIKSVSTFLNK